MELYRQRETEVLREENCPCATRTPTCTTLEMNPELRSEITSPSILVSGCIQRNI